MPCSIFGLQPATLAAIAHMGGGGHGLARQTEEQQYRRSAWAALECWRWRRGTDPASVAHPALVTARPPGSDRAGGGCGGLLRRQNAGHRSAAAGRPCSPADRQLLRRGAAAGGI